MKRIIAVAVIAFVIGSVVANVAGRSMSQVRRELRRMVGYSIVYSGYLEQNVDGRSGKRLVLDNGLVFETISLTLALPMSDVVLFAKPLPKELVSRYPSLPPAYFNSYKLLLDDEIIDVSIAGR